MVSVLVGQVRSMAVDLLRNTGMNQAEALAALEKVAPGDPAIPEPAKLVATGGSSQP